MAFYFVTGKLGNGKTLVTIGRIRDKILSGCLVATNIDLDLEKMFHSRARDINVIRVPDKPTREHLDWIGIGNDTYDEEKNGILVLDECGTWFNSRNWQDKSRKAVNDWMLHARKKGWDVYLIVQDLSIIDSQARESLSEHTVFCRRLDRIRIPFIGPVIKALFGYNLTLPRIFRAKAHYGTSQRDFVSDTWTYRGSDLFHCYDTKQAFLSDYPHGVYWSLTPWHLTGRFRPPRNWSTFMRLTRIHFRRHSRIACFILGFLLAVLAIGYNQYQMHSTLDAYRQALAFYVKSTPSKSSSDPEQSAVDSHDQTSSSSDVFANDLYIRGSLVVNGRYTYEFGRLLDDTEDSAIKITQHQVLSRGYALTQRTSCHAELQKEGDIYHVYCI